MDFLKVSGTDIISSKTEEKKALRGAGLGGWMACVEYLIGL